MNVYLAGQLFEGFSMVVGADSKGEALRVLHEYIKEAVLEDPGGSIWEVDDHQVVLPDQVITLPGATCEGEPRVLFDLDTYEGADDEDGDLPGEWPELTESWEDEGDDR